MVGQVVATLRGDEPWTNLSRPCTWVWTFTDSGRDGEVRHVGSIGGDLTSLDNALHKLISRGHKLHVVYASVATRATGSRPCCCATASPMQARAPGRAHTCAG